MRKGSERLEQRGYRVLRKDPFREEGSRPVRHARTYHRKPEGQEQHQEAKPKDQPHREEELRKREGRFRQNRFFRKCETSFDKRTGYDRAPEQTFDYLNTMKNGSPKEIFQKKEWAERVNHERLEKMKAEWSRDLQEPHQEQGREESQQQGNSISQVPEINQAPQRKKQLEEELDQPRKEVGVLEWVCKLQIHACVRDVCPLYLSLVLKETPTDKVNPPALNLLLFLPMEPIPGI